MYRSFVARHVAIAAVLAISTLVAATTVRAAEPPRSQSASSASARASLTAQAAAPQPQARNETRNDYYEYRNTQAQERRNYDRPAPPTTVQTHDKPSYQFTNVAPRSLW